MIEYLIKSGLILIILLAVYHMFLEQEKMHRFNRFYLLACLVFGLTVPLISLDIQSPPIQVVKLYNVNDIIIQPLIALPPAVNGSPVGKFDYAELLSIVYAVIACMLFLKFFVNLFKIIVRIARNPQQKTRRGTVVMLTEQVVPHSFLSYIFLNENDYKLNKVEPEVMTHEFAHIRQKHSIDLLFIEILKIAFWFNPIFILYRKAIQLNHEFLADEAVVLSTHDLKAYQYLLLQKAGLKTIRLATNLNYSVTKKRFKMMKKQTPMAWKVIKGLSLVPVAALLILAFSDKAFTKVVPAKTQSKSGLSVNLQTAKEEYYKGALIRFTGPNGKRRAERYESLTPQEKTMLPDPPRKKQLFNTWWNPQDRVVFFFGGC